MSVLKACSGDAPAAEAAAPPPARPVSAQPAPDAAPKTTPEPAEPRAAKPETRSAGAATVDADRLFRLMHDRLAETNPLLQHFFSEGRLAQVSGHRLELRFAGSNAAMHADMLGREKAGLEKMARMLSEDADLTLDIRAVKKNAETMSFAEKTAAIVGDVPIESR
jgi:hypothetical protein